jgi:hypothetical protein
MGKRTIRFQHGSRKLPAARQRFKLFVDFSMVVGVFLPHTDHSDSFKVRNRKQPCGAP